MSKLSLFLFGSPRLEREGVPLEISRRKAMAMLAYLAVTGQSYSRDALAALFWPESEPGLARAALRKALFVLNKALAGEGLVVGAETIGLSQTTIVWLDVAQFQGALAESQAHSHAIAELCPDCIPLLISAVEIYAADFLAGFTLPDCPAFDEWQFFQAENYRQALARALEQLAQSYSAQGQFELALPHARRWLALDPLHEAAHRCLMGLYAQAGQQSAALRQYQECTRLLEEELGASPEEATTALYEAIRTRRLSPPQRQSRKAAGSRSREEGFPPAPASPEDDAPSSPPVAFVAREHELAQLEALLKDTLAGQGRVIFVTGEAGRGKTALLQEFARRALEQYPNLIVAAGHCNAYTGIGDPYLPFRQILGSLTGDTELLTGVMNRQYTRRLSALAPQTVQALMKLGPDLVKTLLSGSAWLNRFASATPVSPIPSHGEGVEPTLDWPVQLQAWLAHQGEAKSSTYFTQHDLFEQYSRVLRTLARKQPLLLLLDDLQWADASSISLLFHLGRQLDESQILVIGAYRPTEVMPGPPAAPSRSTPTEGGIPGIQEQHPLESVVNEFQRKFGQIQVDLRQANGRQFVEAFVDTQPNRLDAGFREMLYQRTQGHALFTIEILRGMQERGDLAQDEAGRWVEGPAINWEALPPRVEGVIAQRLGRLPEALQEILKVASVEGEEFTAEVVAQVVAMDEQQVVRQLSSVLDRQRRLVMGQGSRRLDSSGQRLSRYRFRHILFQRYLYHNLDEVERTYLHETVGKRLEQLYGTQTEEIAPQLARHFEAAGLAPKAIDYLLAAGDRAASIYANAGAIAYFSQALALARPGATTEMLIGLYRRLGRALELEAQINRALATYEEMERLARQRGDQSMALAALMAQATLYSTPTSIYDPVQGQALTEQALVLAQELGDQAAEAKIWHNLSNIYSYINKLSPAIASGEHALTLARQLNLREQMAFTLNDLGAHCYQVCCNFDQAKTALGEAAGLWRELGNLPMLTDSLAGLCSVHVYTGAYEPAIAFSEEASQISQTIGNLWGQSYSRYKIGWAYWERGEPDQAISLMEESIHLSKLAGFLAPQIITQADLAAVYGSLGALERGLETAHVALTTATRQSPLRQLYVLGILAQLYLQSDRLAEAEALIAQSKRDPNREAFPLYTLTIPLAEIELALRQGNYQRAVTESSSLLAQLRQYGMKSQLPKALYLQGLAFLRLNQVHLACERLAEAHTAAEAVGSQRMLWQILATLSQLEPDPTQANRLRQQAQEIVEYIADHIGNSELQALFLNLVKEELAGKPD